MTSRPAGSIDELVAAGTRRMSVADAGEMLTLQRAAWVSEAIDAGTLAIPALHETLGDVTAQLGDPDVVAWAYLEGPRLVATVRTSSATRPGVAFLGRLAVVPDRVGEGLGGAMLRLGEARAPAGTRTIELVTGDRSSANHRFYLANGYTLVTGADGPPGTVTFTRDL